jgi:hypothetical protein
MPLNLIVIIGNVPGPVAVPILTRFQESLYSSSIEESSLKEPLMRQMRQEPNSLIQII